MPFTWVDWAIVAIIAISALISLSRGFVKEALSLLTWIVAGSSPGCSADPWPFIWPVISKTLRSRHRGLRHHVHRHACWWDNGQLSYRRIDTCHPGLSGTDRFLGMAFGAARVALLVVVRSAVEPGSGTAGCIVAGVESRAKISIGLQIGPEPHIGVEQSSGLPAESAYPLKFRSRSSSCRRPKRRSECCSVQIH